MFGKVQIIYSYIFLMLYFAAMFIGGDHFFLGLAAEVIITAVAYYVGRRLGLGVFLFLYTPLSMLLSYLIISAFI